MLQELWRWHTHPVALLEMVALHWILGLAMGSWCRLILTGQSCPYGFPPDLQETELADCQWINR